MMKRRIEVIESAVAELKSLLLDRTPFDFLRFIQRIKPLFEDETCQFEPDAIKRLKLLQEAVYVVCMGYAAGQLNSWPQKEAFILAEIVWLEQLAQDYRARIPTEI